MNENQTDRDEWLAAVEHNRKERIALLELASFMGWEESPLLPNSLTEARTKTRQEFKWLSGSEGENHNDR